MHAFVSGKRLLDRVVIRTILAKVERIMLKCRLKIFDIEPTACLSTLETYRRRHLGILEMSSDKFKEK